MKHAFYRHGCGVKTFSPKINKRRHAQCPQGTKLHTLASLLSLEPVPIYLYLFLKKIFQHLNGRTNQFSGFQLFQHANMNPHTQHRCKDKRQWRDGLKRVRHTSRQVHRVMFNPDQEVQLSNIKPHFHSMLTTTALHGIQPENS